MGTLRLLSVAHGKTYLPNWLLNNDLKDHFFFLFIIFFSEVSLSEKGVLPVLELPAAQQINANPYFPSRSEPSVALWDLVILF